jgi:hypothetical protein
MTVVKGTCPDCGDLDLQVWQLLLHIHDETIRYEFTCATCERDVLRETDQSTCDALVAAGVRFIHVPAPINAAYVAYATRYLRSTDLLVADILAAES